MKKSNGVTLIALIITVIILLILAGVVIAMTIGDEGIISKASKAVDEYTKASMKEQLAMYISEATYDYCLNNPEGKTYLEFVAEYLENKEDAIIDIVEQNENELIINYTQGKNIVQLSLSSDGVLEIVRSGTTEKGIEDVYAPKVSYDASTTSSVTVTLKDSSGVIAYAYSLESTKPNSDSAEWITIEETQKVQIKITGLTANKTYYVFAKDRAGNISEGKVCKTVDYIPIEYTVVQKGMNFIVTVTSNPNNIMYQIDAGEEKTYTSAFTVQSGSTVYLWNAENRTLTEKSETVLADVVVTYKESSLATTALETINTKHTATITLISKPSSLSKEKFEFIGWSEKEDASEDEVLSSSYTVPNYNVTLYPVWKSKRVSISLVGAVGETISVYDGDTLVATSTALNEAGNSTKNITVPIKNLKFVGSISKYEKTVEVTNDTIEVKVMPEGALYWYGYASSKISLSVTRGSPTVEKRTNCIYSKFNSDKSESFLITTSKIDLTDYNTIHWKRNHISGSHPMFVSLSKNYIRYVEGNGTYHDHNPPNHYIISFANSGCTYNINQATGSYNVFIMSNDRDGYTIDETYAIWFE